MAFFDNQRVMPSVITDADGNLIDLPTNAGLSDLVAAVETLTTPADTQPVSVAALPLPAGAATLTAQADIINALEDLTTPLDTQPVNQVERPTFTVIAPSAALGNGKSLLSLVNGASVNLVRIRSISLRNVQTSATTGVAAEIQLRRCTGHSAGTALTPATHDTADMTNSTARTGATLAGEAAGYLDRAWWSTDEWGPGTADTESGDHAAQTVGPAWSYTPPLKGIVLRPGEGLTIRCNTNTTSGTFDVVVTYTESA